MKNKVKFVGLVMCLMLCVSLVCALFACTPNDKPNPDDNDPKPDLSQYQFVFTGTGKAQTGRELDFTMVGNKDNAKTLTITVKQLPALSLGGTYELVAGKGYKLHINDSAKTLKYTQYDAATKTFSVSFNVNVGSYGSPKVDFTFVDEAFASGYDGVGLGKEPPVFKTNGWVGGVISVDGELTCAEDGTFATTDTWHVSRTGTWAYDEANNQYVFTFDDASREVFYNLVQSRKEAGGWKGLTYKPWRTNGTEEENQPAQVLQEEDLEKVNYFRDPVVCKWDESKQCYSGEIQVLWNLQEAQFRSEVTRFVLTYAD